MLRICHEFINFSLDCSFGIYIFYFQFLTKQLDLLRDSSESRMRVYEELDRNTQELEKTNQRLLLDAKGDKQRIEK